MRLGEAVTKHMTLALLAVAELELSSHAHTVRCGPPDDQIQRVTGTSINMYHGYIPKGL